MDGATMENTGCVVCNMGKFSTQAGKSNCGERCHPGKYQNGTAEHQTAKTQAKKGDVFDAELHEAITQISAPTEEDKGKIIDIIEIGYQLGDRIIRYPKVVVGQ